MAACLPASAARLPWQRTCAFGSDSVQNPTLPYPAPAHVHQRRSPAGRAGARGAAGGRAEGRGGARQQGRRCARSGRAPAGGRRRGARRAARAAGCAHRGAGAVAHDTVAGVPRLPAPRPARRLTVCWQASKWHWVALGAAAREAAARLRPASHVKARTMPPRHAKGLPGVRGQQGPPFTCLLESVRRSRTPPARLRAHGWQASERAPALAGGRVRGGSRSGRGRARGGGAPGGGHPRAGGAGGGAARGRGRPRAPAAGEQLSHGFCTALWITCLLWIIWITCNLFMSHIFVILLRAPHIPAAHRTPQTSTRSLSMHEICSPGLGLPQPGRCPQASRLQPAQLQRGGCPCISHNKAAAHRGACRPRALQAGCRAAQRARARAQAAQAEAAARAADLRAAEQRGVAAEAALRRDRGMAGSAFQLQQVAPPPHRRVKVF